MTTRTPRVCSVSCIPVVVVILLLLNFTLAAQQNTTSNGLTLQFVKAESNGSVSEVASNVLKVVNNSGRRYVFNLEIASPQGWQSMLDAEKVYNVANRDSLFIPVRIIPQKDATGNVNYFINATAVTTQGIPVASAPWSMQIKKVSRWFASLQNNEAYFPSGGNETEFSINVKNQGNSPENVQILFNPSAKIQITNLEGEPFAENSLNLALAVDVDTTLTFKARLDDKAKKESFFSAGAVNEEEESQTDYKVQIQIRDISGNRSSWGGRVDLKKLKKVVKFDSDLGSSTLPLRVEFNTYNILSQFTNFTLDLSGDAELGNDRFLRYYYQTIISTNSLSGTQFLGSYRFAQYRTPKFFVSAGDIGANKELLLNGTGIRGGYNTDKLNVSGIFVTRRQNANLNNNLNSFGATANYRSGKGWNASVDLVNQDDQFNQTNRSLINTGVNYRFKNQSRAEVKVGYSNEVHQGANGSFNTPGFGLTARYTGKVKGVSVSTLLRYNSNTFSSQFRGMRGINTNARYQLNDKYFLALRLNVNTRDPEIYSKGVLFPQRFFKRNSYEARLGWNTETGNFVFFPRIMQEELLGVRTTTTGAGISYSSGKMSEAKFFSRFYTGFINALDYEIDPYLVYRWENTLRYKNLNVSARYYFGPFNVLDNLRVVEDGINPQSLFISAFARLNFKEARLSVRPMFNMGYESVLARWRMNISPQFTYFSRSGFEFNATIDFFTINQGESPLASISETGVNAFNPFNQSNSFLRVGIAKDFNFKKPNKKTHDLEVVVFKDLNGNNRRDQGEEYEKDVIVRVNGESLMTDSEGTVIFRDLPEDEYIVNTNLLTNVEGWFKSKGVSVNMDKDQALFIPLKRGVQINGNIIFQRAQFSAIGENRLDLNGIRVIAQDQNGDQYTALTNLDGNFRLYVPFGQYTIRVNEQAVDDQFEFAQSSYSLSVNDVSVNYQLSFYLIEKRRRLNIRKFDNN